MGHQDIGRSPATLKWRAVIALIAGGADVTSVAAATSKAAEASLEAYRHDRALRHAFFLLAQIPIAAGSTDFAEALKRLGLEVGEGPNLMDISAAIVQAIDKHASSSRSDLGEMASLSAVESLQAIAGHSLHDLFGSHTSSAQETQEALAALGTVKQFGILAKDFFARLVRRHLNYYLSRELPNHVGTSQRFASVREHLAFEAALEIHCREAAHIVTEFAGKWHSKAHFEGGITEQKAGGFVYHAFEKLRDELRSRATLHA